MVMNDIKVMVVENNQIDMSVITEALTAADIDYIAVGNSRDALSVALKYKPTIAILDTYMPDLSGEEVRKQLHTHPATSNIKVIFLSAAESIDDTLFGLNLHVSAYFKKGVRIGQIINSINAIDGATKLRGSVNSFASMSKVLNDKYSNICALH
jgi:DNA-binding response OmpR family regulator